MPHWKTTSKTTVHTDRWAKVQVDHIVSQDGAESDYTYLTRVGGGGVVIIPYIEHKKSFILVSQYRHPVGKSVWQFPGGSRTGKNTFSQTAQTELLEETGYRADKLIDLGDLYPDVGILGDKGKIFIALNPAKTTKATTTDTNEQTEVKEFSLTEIETMIKDGTIRDGWTLGAYTLFNLWIKKK